MKMVIIHASSYATFYSPIFARVQFVIISLRNNMFELADRLVGIYKTNNATKSVTIDPKLFAQAHHAPGSSAHTLLQQAKALADRTNAPTAPPAVAT